MAAPTTRARNSLLALTLPVLLSSAVLLPQTDPTKAELMEVKKGYAHRLLDAVVLQDYVTIRDQAFRLKAVAETEDWNVSTHEVYARNTDAFIRAAEALVTAAEARNAEGAALAYMDLTLQCVQCHRYLKEHPPEP